MSAMHSKNVGLFRLLAGRCRFQQALALLIGVVATGHHCSYAADSSPPRWHASSSPLMDCQLAAEARRSMMADPVLAEFNMGVTVADGAATVWGAVPDADIAARVRARLSVVAGISIVVEDLRIAPDASLWPTKMTPRVTWPAEKLRTALASGYPRWGSKGFIGTVPAITLNLGPTGTPAVTLLKPTLTDTDLADQLETLRRSVPRFRDVGVRSVGSVVYLRAYNGPPVTVLEFAGRISQLQGVSRVVIEDSRRPTSLSIP
jgi:hypothetical protein